MPGLRIATRGSALARWQADEVARLIRTANPDVHVELVIVETVGDRRLDLPISELGGQGVFIKEVQAAVLDGRADVAVHSAKDLPSSTSTPGLHIGAFLERADPRDALVGSTLDGLPSGATVATGSVRRRAQLAWLRPDLTFADLRGNIPTRLQRVPSGGAVVVAAAALARLSLSDRADEVLDVSVMLPQVGQGAIAVECGDDDATVKELLGALDDSPTRVAVECERGFLASLGSGCDLPVGAYARAGEDEVSVEGMLATADGRVMLKARAEGPAASAAELGARLAEDLLASGGVELLAG
ncbi:MAG TPA: hydroxymethylbilane synthase [Acidimicrobiales bacterium]|nr:hydroxymethylbilane synthase [Acidimicrobiales bacterium]